VLVTGRVRPIRESEVIEGRWGVGIGLGGHAASS
jgi:hypothetical protein